jgi:hypothetical protein
MTLDMEQVKDIIMKSAECNKELIEKIFERMITKNTDLAQFLSAGAMAAMVTRDEFITGLIQGISTMYYIMEIHKDKLDLEELERISNLKS